MSKIKGIVVIGYGGMGKQHIKKLKNVSCIDFKGVYDIDIEKRNEAESNGINVYNSMEQVLANKEVHIILIATPNNTHKTIAIEGMNAGKHVICEKPVALNSCELEEILNTCKKTGQHFMVHQNRRWDENYLMIKQLKDKGTVGNIFYLENRVQGSRGIPSDWRRKKENGGGMVLDWGVHLLDRILLLFKDSKVESIYAELSYILGHEVDDGFKFHIHFLNGSRVLLEVGTMNFMKLPEWYVTGTCGTAIIEDYELHGKYITLNGKIAKDAIPIETGAGLTKTMAPRNDDSVTEHPLPKVKSDVTEFYKNFVQVIDGKVEQTVKNEEVMRVMKLIEAAFESAKKNEVIHFGKMGL